MKSLLVTSLLLFGSLVLLNSCNKIDFLQYLENHKGNLQVYRSSSVDLGKGKASSWITVSHLGAPVEIGVELTRQSLYDLPDTNFSVVVPLPPRAKELTPFDHIHIGWSAHGHPVLGHDSLSFIGPHYDFRFFMTTVEEQLAIPAPTDPSAKFNVHPPEGYMPATYFPNLGGFQGVGQHWNEKIGFAGIRHEMVLGSYNGKVTFIAPIVIIEELRSGNSSSTPYAQPKRFQEHNTYYPTKYNVYPDASGQKEEVTLSDFVRR